MMLSTLTYLHGLYKLAEHFLLLITGQAGNKLAKLFR
jgi:hypothetical protein